MPSIQGIRGPYRLFFVSFDCHEPRHIHVQRERMVCKYWPDPVRLARNYGFSPRELATIRKMILEHRQTITEAWDEHCGNHN